MPSKMIVKLAIGNYCTLQEILSLSIKLHRKLSENYYLFFKSAKVERKYSQNQINEPQLCLDKIFSDSPLYAKRHQKG